MPDAIDRCGLGCPVKVATLNLTERRCEVVYLNQVLGKEIGDRIPEFDDVGSRTGLNGRCNAGLKIRPVDEVDRNINSVFGSEGCGLFRKVILRRRHECGAGEDIEGGSALQEIRCALGTH